MVIFELIAWVNTTVRFATGKNQKTKRTTEAADCTIMKFERGGCHQPIVSFAATEKRLHKCC